MTAIKCGLTPRGADLGYAGEKWDLGKGWIYQTAR